MIKGRQDNIAVFTAATMTSTLTSAAFAIVDVTGCAIQLVWTGSTAQGVLKLQGSCDPDPASVTNWSDLDQWQSPVNGAGDIIFNLHDLHVTAVRVIFTFTSGTGSLTGRINFKGV